MNQREREGGGEGVRRARKSEKSERGKKKMGEKDGVDLPCLCRSDYLILYCADT